MPAESPVTDSLHIRPVLLNDAATVAELSAQLGYPTTPEIMAARIQHLSASDDHAVFVASLDNNVVGWIEVIISRHLHSGSYALISGLVVSDQHRGHGIGSRLCAHAEQWSHEHGQTLIRVRSQISREGAHRFYLREGYRQTKTSAAFQKKLSD
jgi:GNAT superfamily N-acetyltransferase